METSRLEIGCAEIRYLVPARHPAPLRVRQRLDGVIERELPRTVARAFESWFSETDPSVWIIQQLNIEAAVNADCEPAEISRHLAAQIASQLRKALQDGDHDNVCHFQNRAEYLASFLSDLTSGTAWSRWYYQSFDGLKPLPMPTALRTAIWNDLATAKSALDLLPPPELQKVLNALSSPDARRILDRFAEQESAVEEALCREAVARTMSIHLVHLTGLADEWRRALYLFIVAGRETVETGGAPLLAASVAAAKLMDHLSGASEAETQKLIAAYAGKAPWSFSSTHEAVQVTSDLRTTAFGQIFLLLPHLDEMPLPEATREWPGCGGVGAVSLARWLVLLKSCGRDQALRAFHDPLLRELLSIDGSVSPETLRSWQARLTPKHLENFLAALIEWQSLRGAIAGTEQLLAGAIRRGTPPELVLLDLARGLWLQIARQIPRQPRESLRALRGSLERLVQAQGVLYSESSVALLRENFPRLNVIDLADYAPAPDGAENHSAHAIITRLDKLQGDLEFLRLPPRLRIARPLDRLLSIAAQQLLRGFAWRLPGFAASNLPYLSRNFLELGASIEDDDARRIVRLGRPPLHLVLNMTGMTRQSYRLSWSDERPFALFQQD